MGERHPFRLVARLGEGLDQLEPLGELLRLEFGRRFDDLLAQLRRHLLEIERFEHFADRFRADHGGEAVGAEFILRLDVIVLGQELTVLERRQSRLEHDVMLEIKDALEILKRHVEQKADARRQRLQKPDMRHRRGKLDVAHALAPHAAQRHLDRALLADDALVLHALVLAAQALVVLDRPENARAEQAVALGLEGAVIDGLGLFDLAVRPGQNLIGARDRDPDLVEDLNRHLRAEKIHDLLVHRLLRLPTMSAAVSILFTVMPREGGAPSIHPRCGLLDPPPARAMTIVRAGRMPPSSHYSAASDMPSPPPRCCLELCRSTFNPSERISLTRTLNDSGMPDSNASSPRTMDS